MDHGTHLLAVGGEPDLVAAVLSHPVFQHQGQLRGDADTIVQIQDAVLMPLVIGVAAFRRKLVVGDIFDAIDAVPQL